MREHNLACQLTAVPGDELTAIRRDLRTSLSMMPPASPMCGPAAAYLAAITAELDRRRARPPAPAGPGSAGP